MAYPPGIFQSQFNTATSLLKTALIKQYPDNPQVVDILDPFVKFVVSPAQNGLIKLPDDYSNILGSPYIFTNPNKDAECGSIPPITTLQQFQVAQNKGACHVTPVYIVPQAEFSERVRSSVDHPTHEFPIGYFTGNGGIKICPYDLTKVFVLYAKKEKNYVYTYTVNPDDTYVVNASDPNFIESEWGTPAFEYLFKAMCSLYAAYVRDPEMTNWTQILTERGIL